jgi:hypothetical protein
MWYNVWNFVGSGTPTPQIGIAETDVTSYLQAVDNEAYFRSSADYMEASNAFLILEKGPKPDLVVEEKWEQERRTAPGGHHATLSVDGEDIEHKRIRRPLKPGKTYKSSFRTRVVCTGDFDTIKVCADDYEVIDELDETNNCLENEWRCEVVGKPDLVIEKKWEQGRKGKYKVYFVVKNIGAATAPKGHYATLSVDGEEIEHKLIRRDLKPGKTYKSSFRTRVVCTTPPFDTIKVCADDFDFVDESNELNNCRENEWPCGGPG